MRSRLLSLYINFPPPSPFSATVPPVPLHHLILSASFFPSSLVVHTQQAFGKLTFIMLHCTQFGF